MKPSKRSQQGLGLISAIFVITTLALLVAGMAALSQRGAEHSSLDTLAQRARTAAQASGQIHWVAHLATSNSEHYQSCSGKPLSLDFSADTQLAGCSSETLCTSSETGRQLTLTVSAVCQSGKLQAADSQVFRALREE